MIKPTLLYLLFVSLSCLLFPPLEAYCRLLWWSLCSVSVSLCCGVSYSMYLLSVWIVGLCNYCCTLCVAPLSSSFQFQCSPHVLPLCLPARLRCRPVNTQAGGRTCVCMFINWFVCIFHRARCVQWEKFSEGILCSERETQWQVSGGVTGASWEKFGNLLATPASCTIHSSEP